MSPRVTARSYSRQSANLSRMAVDDSMDIDVFNTSENVSNSSAPASASQSQAPSGRRALPAAVPPAQPLSTVQASENLPIQERYLQAPSRSRTVRSSAGSSMLQGHRHVPVLEDAVPEYITSVGRQLDEWEGGLSMRRGIEARHSTHRHRQNGQNERTEFQRRASSTQQALMERRMERLAGLDSTLTQARSGSTGYQTRQQSRSVSSRGSMPRRGGFGPRPGAVQDSGSHAGASRAARQAAADEEYLKRSRIYHIPSPGEADQERREMGLSADEPPLTEVVIKEKETLEKILDAQIRRADREKRLKEIHSQRRKLAEDLAKWT